jgi:hypothetical protein
MVTIFQAEEFQVLPTASANITVAEDHVANVTWYGPQPLNRLSALAAIQCPTKISIFLRRNAHVAGCFPA